MFVVDATQSDGIAFPSGRLLENALLTEQGGALRAANRAARNVFGIRTSHQEDPVSTKNHNRFFEARTFASANIHQRGDRADTAVFGWRSGAFGALSSWIVVAAAVVIPHAAVAQTTVSIPANTQVRVSSFTYQTNGVLASEIVEPDGPPADRLQTTYTYDPTYGNRLTSSTTGWDGSATQSRGASIAYDASRRFPTTSTNALGHAETREYDSRFGHTTLLVGPNGIATRWQYDDFGRKTRENRGYESATATTYTDYTTWTYTRCVDLGGCPAVQGISPNHVVIAEVFSAAGARLAPAVKTYFDINNREIRTETEIHTGAAIKVVYKDTVYTKRGLVDRVSRPYASDQTPVWTTFLYDALERVVTETAPNGIATTTTYRGLKTTKMVYTTEGTRSTTATQDSQGKTIEVLDPLGNKTFFVHDAQGNLVQTIDEQANSIRLGYDTRGRKVSMADPDMGSWSYRYNAFGELIGQTDPKSQETSLSYDVLGRITQKTQSDLISNYEYDTAPKGIGKPASVRSDNGYCRTVSYDSLGRANASTVKVGTTGNVCAATSGVETFVSGATFDDAGRLSTSVFPTGVTLKNAYHPTHGFLERVQNFTGGTAGATYWQWQESDSQGRNTKYVYGNSVSTLKAFDPTMGWLNSLLAGSGGNPATADVQYSAYTYESIGNLKQRADRFAIPNMVEKVQYDLNGRLTQYALYDSAGTAEIANTRKSLTYDAIGNIVNKSDIGQYTYNASGQTAVRPHAVTGVRGAVNADYGYDGIGNMITAGNGTSFAYTSYNMVREVGNASTCQRFVHQAEQMRVRQTIYNSACATAGGAQVVADTLYLHPDAANGLSFERETKGGVTSYKHFINAGGMVVAVLTTNTMGVTSSTDGTVNYLHYDHLGSVVAVTSAAGAVIERRSFDPWGKPRQTDGNAGTGELPGGLNAATDRGFTLHEHLEGLGLIHMNGRVYDPTIARFVSADPYVQSPYDGQSYNRYSYVMNDPLDNTDPSGYFVKKLARVWRDEVWRRPVGRAVVAVIAAYLTWGSTLEASVGMEGFTAEEIVDYGIATAGEKAGAAAAAGFVGGAVGSGGDLKAAARGALTAAAFSFVGELGSNAQRLAGHAVVGCLDGAAASGSSRGCGPGAASAFAGKLATNITNNNPIAAAIAGGVAAQLSGGSFKNGALTAAFGYLFNELMHGGYREYADSSTARLRDGGYLPTYSDGVLYNPPIHSPNDYSAIGDWGWHSGTDVAKLSIRGGPFTADYNLDSKNITFVGYSLRPGANFRITDTAYFGLYASGWAPQFKVSWQAGMIMGVDGSIAIGTRGFKVTTGVGGGYFGRVTGKFPVQVVEPGIGSNVAIGMGRF
jgi:RHS repeat-associated protein